MYPYYRQNSRGDKEIIISALMAIAASSELRELVVEGTPADVASSYRLSLSGPDDVLRCTLKALWSVCDQLCKLMSSERTGGSWWAGRELCDLFSISRAAREPVRDIHGTDAPHPEIASLMYAP